MTVETFCSSGQAEPIKGSIHAAAGALVGVMAAYNAVAWCYRRERHLGVNAVIYAAALVWEIRQTRRHCERLVPEPPVMEPRPYVIWSQPPIQQSAARDSRRSADARSTALNNARAS